jgi:phosphoribosyl-ATP pyrophosphohydrolase
MKDLAELFSVLQDRKDNPKTGSYTNELLAHPEKAYRKINEETYEVIYACLCQDKERIISEAGDLLYHLLAVLVKHDVKWEEVLAELESRK